MSFDNIKIYMQNGKLTDLEINYYINKLKKIYITPGYIIN